MGAADETRFGIPVSVWNQDMLGNMSENPNAGFPMAGAAAPAIQEAARAAPADPGIYGADGASMPQPVAAAVQAPSAPRTFEEARAEAMRRVETNQPLEPGDLQLLDTNMAGKAAKAASSTTSGVSRAMAPTGPEWAANQANQAAGLANRQGIRQNEANNVADLARAQDEHANTMVHFADAQAAQLTHLGDQQREAEASYKEQLDKTMAEQADANTAYQKAAKDYDPNRLMSGGKQALGAIALALGSFGAALTHTPNSAMQIIENAINRDIDKQKAGIAAKKENVTWLDRVAANNRSRFQDENAARLQTRANAKEVWATYIDGETQKLQGTEALARGKQMSDQIRMSGEDDAKQARDLEAARLQAQAGTRSSSTTSQSAAPVAVDLIARIKAQAEAKSAYDKAWNSGEKLTPAQQKQEVDVNKALSAYAASIADNKRYQGLNNKQDGMLGGAMSRTFGLEDTDKQQATVATSLGHNLAMAQNKGTLSDNDVRAALDELNGGAWTSHGLNVKANELARTTGKKIAAEIASLPPSAQSQAVDRFVQMVGPEQAKALLSGAGITTKEDAGRAGGGR